ncbi:threonine/serine ThrE exporter family protein [Pirellulaceae bacterium SH467]
MPSLKNSPQSGSTDEFLIRTAELLHQHGTPSHRLERVMTKVAKSLGIQSVFLYTPTALIASLGEGSSERTYMRRVDSGIVDADKLIRFDETLERLEAGQIDVGQARRELEEAASARPPYSSSLTALACSIGCVSIAIFFGGGFPEVVAAGLIGLAIACLEELHAWMKWESGLLFPVAGFVAAMSAISVSKWVTPLDDRLVTLASLVILLPGFTLTIALTELAVGHLSAGVARLAGACVTLLTLFLGVAIAWKLMQGVRIPPVQALPLPGWCNWLAIAVAPVTFAILFRVRVSQWLVVLTVCWTGFLTSRLLGERFGIEVGSFAGAIVVGAGSNLYARLRDRPAMVPQAPGMILLVPGSLGYRSLSALQERETLQGIDFAYGMVLVAMSLVGGLLAATALVPPKRIL